MNADRSAGCCKERLSSCNGSPCCNSTCYSPANFFAPSLLSTLVDPMMHASTVTIRNDVSIQKETLKFESDESDPGKFLVTFTFDADSAGSITVVFFGKEGEACCLTPTKEGLLQPVTVQFQKGLSQKFVQPSGTGIDLSMFSEVELSNEGEMSVYPLSVKAEALLDIGSTNSQLTQAVFEKDKGEYRIKALNEILWVNGLRYDLQDIYGLEPVDKKFDGNDPEKECVSCVSETRDTTFLPCRHTCMCSGCANVFMLQTNKCPICRQTVERLLKIKVSNHSEE